MKREILFRGKRVEIGPFATESVCEWVYGGYAQDSSGTYIYDFTRPKRMVKVDASTVGEYTGLTDKNGKKIFEGDIVRLVQDWHDGTYGTWYAVVEFGNPNGTYSWGWQLKPITECKFNPDILLWVDMEETGVSCEVIGNVWDNSELPEGDGHG